MTTYKFGGTSLESFGSINVIDDFFDVPPRRGQNIVIPYRHGSIHVTKFFGERVMIFGITMDDTSISGLETSIDSLRALIAPRAEQTLQATLADASVREVAAVVNKPMGFRRLGPYLARITLEFVLAKPFWRSDTAIADNTTTIDASPHAMTVNNSGTVEERDATIILTGPLSNTVITNTENSDTLTYTGTISAGHTVTITTSASGEYTATHSVNGNVIGNVTHSGDSALMVFEVGNNVLSITDDTATTGTVKVTFYPPYL